ncbi:MAG: DedA family protein [Desulfobacteraceae bacterium]|jgi:membrane protein YqaA with SNARE-associated domain|nr:DedA family protein [Desulfobacteraceae bacterium]
MLRRLYDWVLHWADTPYGTWALFLLAFCESSFFPIPPDILLIALAVAVPAKAIRYALVCSVGSVLGGALGYLIGWQFMAAIGERIVAFYGLEGKVRLIEEVYQRYDAWAVGIAGFTPIPYKVFTIAAGMFKVNFWVFMIASLVSRSARFFLLGGLIYAFGPRIQRFIDRYFNTLAVVFCVLLVLGFILIRYLF